MSVALPRRRETFPRTVSPSRKVTLPDGATRGWLRFLTVAVRESGRANVVDLGLIVRAVRVLYRLATGGEGCAVSLGAGLGGGTGPGISGPVPVGKGVGLGFGVGIGVGNGVEVGVGDGCEMGAESR